MLDLGTSFLASVSRDPRALALVDGETRLTYAEWFGSFPRPWPGSTGSG